MITALVPRSGRRAVKGWVKRLRRAYASAMYTFGPADLAVLLQSLGLRPGNVVLVHSSYDAFEGFSGKPTDVIGVLQHVVGPTGTLLMPTMPFTGTALDYATRGRTFDVRRTPSSMGLLTELFRRSPGVLRSVHPTHPFAVWGAKAETLVSGHHLARTPCGAGSPVARLLDHDGAILLLGTGISVLTFFHTVEELLEPELPFSPFTRETFSLPSRDGDGRLVMSTMRLFDPDRSRRRNLETLVPALRKRGAWRESRVGRLRAVLLNATDVLETCRVLAASGVYCYDD